MIIGMPPATVNFLSELGATSDALQILIQLILDAVPSSPLVGGPLYLFCIMHLAGEMHTTIGDAW